MIPTEPNHLDDPLAPLTPIVDEALMGAWSHRLCTSAAEPSDTRILFWPEGVGRFETWYAHLTECVTFRWTMMAPGWVTLMGVDYCFRDRAQIRREPCDWHFPDCPYEIVQGGESPVLHLHLGGGRCDEYALFARDLQTHREPRWHDAQSNGPLV
jgi:hypothetical protein